MTFTDRYTIRMGERAIGSYYVWEDGSVSYNTGWGCPWDIEKELKELGLDRDVEQRRKPIRSLAELTEETNRVPGTRRRIYEKAPLRAEREAEPTGERYSVYRRSAEKGDPDYSDLPHDAPHSEGPHTPEGMREWASWYQFNKMDDGTYEAELDEAWWWGGGHNDGGTIRRIIPEEWQDLPYDEFLERVVTVSAAAHYGFTAEMLRKKKGLREFFGYGEDPDA